MRINEKNYSHFLSSCRRLFVCLFVFKKKKLGVIIMIMIGNLVAAFLVGSLGLGSYRTRLKCFCYNPFLYDSIDNNNKKMAEESWFGLTNTRFKATTRKCTNVFCRHIAHLSSRQYFVLFVFFVSVRSNRVGYTPRLLSPPQRTSVT